MSSTTPYLGSKISLVSKAKIRYEGILYTIDTNESTVALAKVRSLGTEDRPTDRPVAARDEVYEYIIFRGSDIEDLHVCEPYSAQKQTNQLPSNLIQDPAIVKTSAAPVFPTVPSTTLPAQSSMPAMPSMPTTVSTAVGSKSNNSSRDVQQQTSQRQQTSQSSKRTSPTQDSSIQVDSEKQDKRERDHQRSSAHKETRNNNQQQSTTEFNMNRLSYNNNTNQRNNNYNNDFNQRGNQQSFNQNNDFNNQQRNRMMGSTSSYSNNQMTNSSSNQNGFRRNNNNGQNNAVGSQRNNQQMSRNQQYNNNSMTSPRPNQQVQRNTDTRRSQRAPGSSTTTNTQRVAVEPLKFEGEFNFEEANDRFVQEIEKEFTDKLKISGSKSHNDSSLNTSQELQSMQDQAHTMMKQKMMDNESVKRDDKPHHDITEDKNCYDKSSSFFDRISCESSDKLVSKPKNWKDERKMNVETFGMLLRQSNDNRRNYHRGGNQNYGARRQMNQGQYRGNNNNNNQNNGMRYNNQNQNNNNRMSNSNGQPRQNNTNGMQSTYRPRTEVQVGGGNDGFQSRSNNGYRRYNAGSR